MNSNYRIAATLFHRDLVCLRNISVNTLHKGSDVKKWMLFDSMKN
jgi:hypothetical protein